MSSSCVLRLHAARPGGDSSARQFWNRKFHTCAATAQPLFDGRPVPGDRAACAMFWSQFILAKQGPLGTIWIAAHSVNANKLRKSQIAETDLAESCGAQPPWTWGACCVRRWLTGAFARCGPQTQSSTRRSTNKRCPWRCACRASCCWAWSASTHASWTSCSGTARRRWSRLARCVCLDGWADAHAGSVPTSVTHTPRPPTR